MSKFTKRVLGLCSALLMSFVSGPSINAMKYKANNFFLKYKALEKDLKNKVNSDPLLSKLGLNINVKRRNLVNELLVQDLAEHLTEVDDSKKIKIDDGLERTEAFECPICLNDVNPSDPAYCCDACAKGENYYHIDCVLDWVAQQKSQNMSPECPTCKGPMPRYTPCFVIPKSMVAAAYACQYGNLRELAKKQLKYDF